MSFKTFRDSFLTEAEARVTAVNPTTATTNDMLVAGALYKMAASVASVDLISTQALSLLTTMSAAQLESYLQDPDAMLSFQQIAADTPTMNTLALNGSAMNAIAASTTAMNAIAASTTAMNAIAASATAMNAIAASTTAMNAIAASPLLTTYTSPKNTWVPSGASGQQVIFSGRCLLVQAQILPTASYLSNPGGSGQGVYVDGVVTYFTATHNYNMVAGEVLTTPKMVVCNSSLGINAYCGLIVTYIPL